MEAPVTTTMEDTAAPASKAGQERIVTKVSSTKKEIEQEYRWDCYAWGNRFHVDSCDKFQFLKGWKNERTFKDVQIIDLLCKKISNFTLFPLFISHPDIDECSLASGNPCKNNGKCFNLLGSYKCTCALGFIGKHCENGKFDW